MMPKSTANFIAYDMRPAKQTERRGIVELLNCARFAGFDVSKYRYLGFGGTKFIDFQLMHKHVGFAHYQSVEHDLDLHARCVFNKPFQSLKVYQGALSDFLITDTYDGNNVYWLDYELCIGKELLSDLNSVASRIKDGDFLFVSISGELPSGLEKSKDKTGVLRSRIPSLKSYINKLTPNEFTPKVFPKTAGKLLLLMLESAFSIRHTDGAFIPSFKVIYKDSSWMVTVGGAFIKRGSRKKRRLAEAVAQSIPAMCPEDLSDFYQIPNFNFTALERILIDKSGVSDGSGYTRRLLRLGISEDTLREYERIARLVPKYSEIAF